MYVDHNYACDVNNKDLKNLRLELIRVAGQTDTHQRWTSTVNNYTVNNYTLNNG